MRWSAAALGVPGKTGDAGLTLPAITHLEDCGNVADLLWERWVSARIKAVLAEDLGGEALAGRVLRWLCSVHDIGKFTPDFVRMLANAPGWSHLLDTLPPTLPVPEPRTARLTPHRVSGHKILHRWLVDRSGFDGFVAHSVAGIIGAHHGVPPTSLQLGDAAVGASGWVGVQNEVLDGMAGRAGVAEDLRHLGVGEALPLRAQVLLAGLVVVADWLSSDQGRFPVDRHGPIDPRDVIDDWDLPAAWSPPREGADLAEHLCTRFPHLAGGKPRPIQSLVDGAVSRVSGPAILIVEGDLGGGKTEAALLAAEHLASRLGLGGLVFCLPTRATTDGIFPRLLTWVEHLPGSGTTSVVLAHGKARHNEDYRGFAFGERISSVEPDEGAHLNPVASSWLVGRRKGVLANFVAATIDQVLVLALRSRFLQLRHLACAGKVVVIDEVHAADDYMRAYLVRALEWLGAYGTPVILVSATLPPAVRAELAGAWCHGAGAPAPAPDEADIYPRVTVAGPGGHSTHAGDVTGDLRRQFDIVLLAERAAADQVVDAVKAGACVAVIRNTVARAQRSYEELVARLGPDQVVLLHSRFVAPDRASRETAVRRALGPPGQAEVDRPTGLLVVGTQVLEQSLDVDFDLMVTDVAPADLLLQRAGRLHRHRRGDAERDRPECVRNARLLIVGVEPGAVGPTIDAGARAVYGEWRILQALAAITPHLEGRPVTLPDDIAPLVRQGYDNTAVAPPGWERRWSEARERHAREEKERRARADAFRLGGYPHTQERDLRDWIDGRAGEPDEAKGQAAVRDGVESLEVVPVVRDGQAIRAFPGVGVGVDIDLAGQFAAPRDDVALRIASCTLPLPPAMTRFRPGPRGAPIDRVIRQLESEARVVEGWRESRWLCGVLPLIFDRDAAGELVATVDDWQCVYDQYRGLVTTRIDRKGQAS